MKAQKRPGFQALTDLPTHFIFYYEFIHAIVLLHKSGLIFFGKRVNNKATKGQVIGLAGLYGI